MRHAKHALAAACLATLVTGCTLAPVYERPAPPLPADWTTGATAQAQPGAELRDWEHVVNDVPMKTLIELALDNNRDLRAAAARIEKAEAAYQVVRADLFPKLDGFAKAELNPNTRKRLGNNTNAYHSYVVGVGFSNWELDFFGRLRSLKEQALEYYLSTDSARKTAELALVAEVATIYLRLVADREHLAAEREVLKAAEGTLELVQVRHAQGAASEMELNQALMAAQVTRTNAEQFAAQVTADENNLAVLVGLPLEPSMMPAKTLAEVTPFSPVPAGLPSEVLTRRPDVLEAEHLLKGANANIGAARALHFPQITLTSSFGTASDKLNGLFKAGSWAWSLAPQASIPIFHSGAINATVNEAIADRNIYVALYEKAVQNAFREVSDSLALGAALNNQVDAQSSLAKASGKNLELSSYRAEIGQDSQIARLEAQRAHALAQHDYIRARSFQQISVMTLYKALGGGWTGDTAADPKVWVAQQDSDMPRTNDKQP